MPTREPNRLATSPAIVFGTSFLEGASVLVVELAGARALAPFYGTSIVVWTSQITATLLFLALGYLAGGWMSRWWRPWHLGALFVVAGLWLCLLPLLRGPLLNGTAYSLGIALGSFVSASILFGLPLACFGAVSPVLIEHWNRVKPGAGGAAGMVFFVNTIGGLAGAWLTALVLIPNLPMRVSMIGCGVLLVLLGIAWYFLLVRYRKPAGPVAAIVVAVGLVVSAPGPLREMSSGGQLVRVSHTAQSSVGLIQVLDVPSRKSRYLVLDGVTQGGVNTVHGYSASEFSEYQNVLSHGYHSEARTALVLGMGAAALVRQLHARGISVTVVELEPRVVEVARRFFDLPEEVTVRIGDARAELGQLNGQWDLIFLDLFAGETVPWHAVTREGLTALKARLAPGGRVVVNTVSFLGGSGGLERLEATLLDVFEGVVVHDESGSRGPDSLGNTILVAGRDLRLTDVRFPGNFDPEFLEKISGLKKNSRPARAVARVSTDDWSDLDFVDARLRMRWRELVLKSFRAEMLGD